MLRNDKIDVKSSLLILLDVELDTFGGDAASYQLTAFLKIKIGKI